MLHALIRAYLLESGYTVSTCPDGTEAWYHPSLGTRAFEEAVIWQMTREGAYGDLAAGWRQVSVPVPVHARNSREIPEAVS